MDRTTIADGIAARLAAAGWLEAPIPEAAARLGAQADRVLAFADGYSFSIVCLVDGERRPGARWGLSAEATRAVVADLAGDRRVTRSIVVIEVAPEPVAERAAALEDFRGSRSYERRPVVACVVDARDGAVWSTARRWRRRLERLLATPVPSAEAIAELHDVAVRPQRPAWATWGLAALLIAIHASVIHLDGSGSLLADPSTTTLAALGGVTRTLVVEAGEWFRLLTAEFLHASLAHLGFNLLALVLAGLTLERLVGPSWFLTIFLVGAVGASGLSILVNPPDLVGIGASGGIMALFAATLVLAQRFPPGAERSRLRMNSIRILLPTLVAIGPSGDGSTIDFGAHLGGALTGLALGGGLLAVWPRRRASPGLAPLTLAVLGGAMATIAVALPSLIADLAVVRARHDLAPSAEISALRRDALAGGSRYVTDHPGDPRGHLLVAGRLVDRGDFVGAEAAARRGLALGPALRLFDVELRRSLEMALGLALIGRGREEEARPHLAEACRSERVRSNARMAERCP